MSVALNSDYKIVEQGGGRYKATYTINKNLVPSELEVDLVTTCIIHVSEDSWTITSWFTEEKYKHHGYGTELLWILLHTLKHIYGKPQTVKYIWNGANQYVYDFLVEHFDAKCTTPIAVQKYQTEDDWSSHIYVLDVNKFNEYFNL